MKRLIPILLALSLLLSLATPALAFGTERSAQQLIVDGAPVDCEKYNIDGSNYFKLRDLAKLLDGTPAQFDVGWDAQAGVVSIATGSPYTTANGTELVIGPDQSATAQASSATIKIDGEIRSDLSAYNIGGSNYFKLRDLGGALGFTVGYNAALNAATVDSGVEVRPSLTLDRSSLALRVGSAVTLVATVRPYGSPLTWTSSNHSVAVVDQNGRVVGVGVGSTEIIVYLGNHGVVCPVTVFTAERSAQKLSVNGKQIECEKYNINGSNYFKLRDLAKLFNGTAAQFDVGWNAAAGLVSITTHHAYTTANGAELVVGPDGSASAQPSSARIEIDGEIRSDLSAYNIGGSNYFKLRDLGDALGFNVSYDASTNSAVANSPDYRPPAVALTERSFSTSDGSLSVWVLTVDASDPRVRVRSAMVNNTLGATADFRNIVAASGCYAAVNANFFEAYQTFQTPIGHVMVGGQFLHGVSGNTSLGVDAQGKLYMGREMVFTRVRDAAGHSWTAYEINSVKGQFEGNTVLYTPAYGTELTLEIGARIMTVRNQTVRDYRWVDAGTTVSIPSDGYLLFLTQSYVSQGWVYPPTIGASVSDPEPYLFTSDDDSFPLSGIVSMVSGSPRLIQHGSICYDLDNGNQDLSRFGPGVKTPRTAVGIGADGKLILVSAGAASIQQLREIMHALGCTEAMNLDGGASRGLYCDGQFKAIPGRYLTTTLQIFYQE